MLLTSITTLVVTLASISHAASSPTSTEGVPSSTARVSCPDFGPIEHGILKPNDGASDQIAVVQCNEGYDLDGPQTIYCIEGKWEQIQRPHCTRRCRRPPILHNGSLQIESMGDGNGLFHKGTVASYACGNGFVLVPQESKLRVCEKGIWTGANASCIPVRRDLTCPVPRVITNGYFVQEQSSDYKGYHEGQRLHYSCKPGYVLEGTAVQQCLEGGTWSPKIPPVCLAQITEDPNDYTCPVAPTIPHSYTTVIEGDQSENQASPGTILQIRCFGKYKNVRAPCQPGKLQCIGGRWVGTTPKCVPAHDCDPPSAVSYAVIYSPEFRDIALTNKYPIKSQISYQCLPGYTLQGNDIFTCSPGACWLPVDPPSCYRAPTNNYFLEVNSINAVLVSGATGAGVLGLLLVICLITVCRRRKPLTRAVPITTAVPRADLGDHATLLHHPDRLALIAFADGMQNEQASLPTYDEATRDRTSALTSTRLHRPHWPNLGARRSRNGGPTPGDAAYVTRHGSFASHTPSTRSTGDSMGSTDTVAVSEGSTNVTLDTASSYSGSQPASCRGHCGSLASFDTSSVVNTEGVPLLEESELEEFQGGDNLSLVVDNPSISDNASFKLSTNSADFS